MKHFKFLVELKNSKENETLYQKFEIVKIFYFTFIILLVTEHVLIQLPIAKLSEIYCQIDYITNLLTAINFMLNF